ncbi:MAG: hypothetical protein P8180_09140 [Gammaproteobacteria bacterium]
MSNVGFAGQPAFIDDSGNFLAYQLWAGVGYDITSTTAVSVDYRYFGTPNPTFTMVDGTSFDSEARGNNVDLSLRYRFWAGPVRRRASWRPAPPMGGAAPR